MRVRSGVRCERSGRTSANAGRFRRGALRPEESGLTGGPLQKASLWSRRSGSAALMGLHGEFAPRLALRFELFQPARRRSSTRPGFAIRPFELHLRGAALTPLGPRRFLPSRGRLNFGGAFPHDGFKSQSQCGGFLLKFGAKGAFCLTLQHGATRLGCSKNAVHRFQGKRVPFEKRCRHCAIFVRGLRAFRLSDATRERRGLCVGCLYSRHDGSIRKRSSVRILTIFIRGRRADCASLLTISASERNWASADTKSVADRGGRRSRGAPIGLCRRKLLAPSDLSKAFPQRVKVKEDPPSPGCRRC